MKKVIIFIFFITAFFSAQPVSAHVLKTDKSIGAVVHINPEDDPVVGEETTIFFDVKDKENKFSIRNCECIFKVTKAGTEVFNQRIESTEVQYTFPERNIYVLELVGNPKVAGQFEPFVLRYDVRVERIKEQQSNSETKNEKTFLERHIPHGALLLTVITGAVIFYHYRQKKHG